MSAAIALALLEAHCDLPRREPGAMVVTAIEQACFAPVSAALPDGPSLSVLRGDPAMGPLDMLLRMKRGAGPLHIHSADYRLVVIEGRMKHWAGDGDEAGAKTLGPGGYWFQPGGQAHADACLDESCLMFVTWTGKRDARLAR